ncbi:MAG: Complex I intermediate-associated protein 30, mitochondrial, partial [Vezdaea acicularis]
HRLSAKNPGEWETVFIKWHEFVRTSFGVVVEPQAEMLRQKLRSVGIGLIDRIPGKYDLSIASVWATNELQDVAYRDETHERVIDRP